MYGHMQTIQLFIILFLVILKEVQFYMQEQILGGCYFLYKGIYRCAAAIGQLFQLSNIRLNRKFSTSKFNVSMGGDF